MGIHGAVPAVGARNAQCAASPKDSCCAHTAIGGGAVFLGGFAFNQAANFEGGMHAWVQSGGDIVDSDGNPGVVI